MIHFSQTKRKVLWIWDNEGDTGKTFLADYLQARKGAYVVSGGKYSDLAYSFDLEDYVVFDFARSQRELFPYALVEKFLDLRVYSPKYQSHTKSAAKCNMLICTNFPPDGTQLSRDRWMIREIVEGVLTPREPVAPIVIVEAPRF